MNLLEKNPLNIYNNLTYTSDCDMEYCKCVEPEAGLFFEKYTDRVFDALSVENHSVLITGGHGTGKTTLVKHIQYLINNYKCPKQFYNSDICELDQLKLSYGIKSISEYEERLSAVFSYISKNAKNDKRVILFIDDFYNFMFDNSINSMMSLQFEYAIKSNISIICCSGVIDKKQFDSKYDLIRHFTEIKIKEPSIDDVKKILNSKTDYFAYMYHTKITEEQTNKLTMLCDKYVKNDFCMPLKAIRILENAVVHHMNLVRKPDDITNKKINELVTLNTNLKKSIHDAKTNGDLLKLLNANNEVKECSTYIKDSINVIKHEDMFLTDDDIYSAVSEVAGVPVVKLTESDTSKLKNMIPELMSVVIGQEGAISKVCKTVKRNRLGLRKKNHTIGNFLFIGSTGVGKTFLAKKLAEYMFGSEDSMTRLDMSEYADEISVNKLIGAPPGYVGYGEGGILCNAIKNNPYSVILFDEIEKANPAIFNTIIQLMDEGRITDSNGQQISATNTVIILTSNIGVKEAINSGSPIGFTLNDTDFEKKETTIKKSIIQNSMKRLFSPEFLNRIDSICYFNELSADNMYHIFDNEIKEVYDSLSELGYTLKISNKVKQFIIDKSIKEKMGARALIRNIQQDLVDEMTEMIINEEVSKIINVSLNKKNELVFK